MIATAAAIAVSAPPSARTLAPATHAAPSAPNTARRVRTALGVLFAWTAAVLAASSYVEAWTQRHAESRAGSAAASTVSLEHP